MKIELARMSLQRAKHPSFADEEVQNNWKIGQLQLDVLELRALLELVR
jgi:hypothetical protein